MPVVKISRRIALTLALIAGISITAISYAPASAQETRETGKLFGRGEDGPYAVALYGLPAQPIVSKFGFTVTVESLTESALVADAVVEVVAIDPDGEPEWLSPALSFPPNPTSYVGNAPRPPSPASKPEATNTALGEATRSATTPPAKTANTPTRGSRPVMNPAWDREMPRSSW